MFKEEPPWDRKTEKFSQSTDYHQFFYNMFLYNIIAFFIRELYKVILLESQIGSGKDPYKGSRSGVLADSARKL